LTPVILDHRTLDKDKPTDIHEVSELQIVLAKQDEGSVSGIVFKCKLPKGLTRLGRAMFNGGDNSAQFQLSAQQGLDLIQLSARRRTERLHFKLEVVKGMA